MLPRRSIAMRPSPGNTSAEKLVPWVTMTSAPADLINISRHKMNGNRLRTTIHLQIAELTVINFKTDLHRSAANLAVFDIRLVATTGIQQDTDWFSTERTSDSAFHDSGIHVWVRAAAACRSTVLWKTNARTSAQCRAATWRDREFCFVQTSITRLRSPTA